MTMLAMVQFCARECEKQQSGEMSVYHMVNAYDMAQNYRPGGVDSEFIQYVGKLIDPQKNANGFRQTPVQIGNAIIPWENIPRQILILTHAGGDITPAEFYQEFETIHPFRDGNGRVGAILFNLLNGTLTHPVMPPEYKKPTT